MREKMQFHWTGDAEAAIRAGKASGFQRGDLKKEEATNSQRCVRLNSNNLLILNHTCVKQDSKEYSRNQHTEG